MSVPYWNTNAVPFPSPVKHEVNAGNDGPVLFASLFQLCANYLLLRKTVLAATYVAGVRFMIAVQLPT